MGMEDGRSGWRKISFVFLLARWLLNQNTHKNDPKLNKFSYQYLLIRTNFKTFNMPTAFGINGFGRIGRLVMRAALDNPGTNY